MRILFTIAAIFLVSYSFSRDQATVTVAEAKKHNGEKVTVCDRMLNDALILDPKTRKAVLTIGGQSENNKITIMAPAETIKKLIDKSRLYNNKNVCVTGKITENNGKSEMIVMNNEDIKICDPVPFQDIKPNDFMMFE